MDDKKIFESSRLSDPEGIFYRKPLFYTHREMNEILSNFQNAVKIPEFLPDLERLLMATMDFIGSTDSDSELRRLTNTRADIEKIFDAMHRAWLKAIDASTKLKVEDKKNFSLALDYCKNCILHRSDEFNTDALLTEVWQTSELKKNLENW